MTTDKNKNTTNGTKEQNTTTEKIIITIIGITSTGPRDTTPEPNIKIDIPGYGKRELRDIFPEGLQIDTRMDTGKYGKRFDGKKLIEYLGGNIPEGISFPQNQTIYKDYLLGLLLSLDKPKYQFQFSPETYSGKRDERDLIPTINPDWIRTETKTKTQKIDLLELLG